mgnify:CR=1 FL=1
MAINITAPLSREKARQLRAGDSCLISGVIYTARDAAHKRLCELVEQGKVNCPETDTLLHTILDPYIGKLDALVLGCTHYPFMKKAMAEVLGDGVELLDGGAGTARETRRRLLEAGLLNDGRGELVVENSSGDPEKIRLTHALLEAD